MTSTAPRAARAAKLGAALLRALPLLLAAWLLALRMPWSAALALLPLAASLLPGRARRLRGPAVAAALVVTAALHRVPVNELRASLDRLRERKDRLGPAAYTTADAAGVFGLNLAMGLGGMAAGFPEAAEETLGLAWPGPPVRTWRSDFALRSQKVRTAVRALLAEARARGGREAVAVGPVRVSWARYAPGEDSPRVALALNSPLELGGWARREPGRWRLDLVGRARVEYPRRALLPVPAPGGPLVLDEGLFWVLQRRGWLRPYTAEWRWSVAEDDPRLREP